jgi:hypothetical protein
VQVTANTRKTVARACSSGESSLEASEIFSPSNDFEGSTSINIFKRGWVRLVEEYTSSNLTHDSDKLPALAGLVRKIPANSGDTYLAGLWRGSILDTLNLRVAAWEPDHMCDDPKHDTQVPPPRKSKVQFPTCYCAPSWSWASVNTQIQFPYEVLDSKAKLIDYQVLPADNYPFGRLQSGWIKVWVRLFLHFLYTLQYHFIGLHIQ